MVIYVYSRALSDVDEMDLNQNAIVAQYEAETQAECEAWFNETFNTSEYSYSYAPTGSTNDY
jgi:hypothetical protein